MSLPAGGGRTALAQYMFTERALDVHFTFSEHPLNSIGDPPYEPQTSAGAIFEGVYAIYCGLLLIGVTGLILAPVFHRVMHAFHLPDEGNTGGGAKTRKSTSKPAKR